MRPDYPVITMLGDSITGRADAVGGGGVGWNELLKGLPFRFHNAGIDGNLATDVLARLDRDVRGERTVLMVGINDLSLGMPIPGILSTVRAIMNRHRERKAWIVLQTTLPTAWEDLNVLVQELNDAYRALCRTEHVSLIDSHRAFMKEGEPRTEFLPDGVHLNGAGYRHWAAFLRDQIIRSLPA